MAEFFQIWNDQADHPDEETSLSQEGKFAVVKISTRPTIEIVLHDTSLDLMSDTEVSYRVSMNETVLAEGTTTTGIVAVTLPGACGEQLTVEWGDVDEDGSYTYSNDVLVECGNGEDLPADAASEQAEAVAKLYNLGYRDADYESAVLAFQYDYCIEEHGLTDGRLPEDTRSKLWSIYQDGMACYE